MAMPDGDRLEGIRAQQCDMDEFLREIGMSRASYWRKLKGKTEFTAGEIQRIGQALRLGCDEIMEIFDLK